MPVQKKKQSFAILNTNLTVDTVSVSTNTLNEEQALWPNKVLVKINTPQRIDLEKRLANKEIVKAKFPAKIEFGVERVVKGNIR